MVRKYIFSELFIGHNLHVLPATLVQRVQMRNVAKSNNENDYIYYGGLITIAGDRKLFALIGTSSDNICPRVSRGRRTEEYNGKAGKHDNAQRNGNEREYTEGRHTMPQSLS